MDNNYEKQINEGLAEVCRMLAQYDEQTPKQKEQFLKYAKTFEGFAKIHTNKIEKKEVTMEKKQPSQDEIDNKKVQEIIQEFVSLEKKYSQRLIKKACYRYNNAIVEKNKAEREIKLLEQKLAQAKRKLK